MNYNHSKHGVVEMRGTVGKGRKAKALVNVGGRNIAVDFHDLEPIAESSVKVSSDVRSLGYARRGPARSERSALRLERSDCSRLGCSGSGAARQAIEAARNIAPDSLTDLVAVQPPVIRATHTTRDHGDNDARAELKTEVIKAIKSGAITVEQGRALLLKHNVSC